MDLNKKYLETFTHLPYFKNKTEKRSITPQLFMQ